MTSKGPVVVRRSLSRPSSDGGRKEIPLTASLESLTPSDLEGSTAFEKPGAGARARTPAGAAAPHKIGSASRSSSMQPLQQYQQPGNLPEDDSLVLYKDPSEISTQPSQASVVSGRLPKGETFFTALRRSYSYGSSHSEQDTAEQGQVAFGNLSCADSQLNPMQSPGTSAYFSAGCKDSELASEAGALDDEYGEAASMATCESSYATASEDAHGATEGCLLPTSSVIDVINNLYCTQASACNSQLHQQVQRWREPDADARPLVQSNRLAAAKPEQQGTAVVASADQQLMEQTSCDSSVGSCYPEAASNQGMGGTAAASAVSAQHSAADLGASRSYVAVAQSEHREINLYQEDTLAAEFKCTASEAAQLPAEDDNSTPADVDQAIPGSPAAAFPQSEVILPAVEGGIQGAGDAVRQNATVYLTEVGELLTQRAELQAELSGYIQQVTTQVDEAGQPLVDLPPDYNLMVERMLREQRSQYQALQGWEGPHRFDDLPVAQLPTDHKDPRVAAGLKVIQQLDERLKDVWLKALIAARDAAPDKWAEAEQQRLAKRAEQLDEGLARERQKRLHAARLLRALRKLDEQDGPSDDRGLNSYTYYQLQPHEEQILATVMSRDDAAIEQENPFDLSTVVLDEDSLQDLQVVTAQLAQQSSRCLSALGSSIDKSMSVLLSEHTVIAAETSASAGPAAGELTAALASACSAAEYHAAAAAEVSPAGAAAVMQSHSCRASTAGSSQSASSNRTRHTIAEIDALLNMLRQKTEQQEVQVAKEAVNSTISLTGQVSRCGSSSKASTASSRKVRSSSLSAAGKAASPALSQISGGLPPTAAIDAGAGDRGLTVGQLDYVREQREAKDLAQRALDINAKLRALRLSDLPKPSPAELRALVQQCRQELAGSTVEPLAVT